jgi:hypothetical protein
MLVIAMLAAVVCYDKQELPHFSLFESSASLPAQTDHLLLVSAADNTQLIWCFTQPLCPPHLTIPLFL